MLLLTPIIIIIIVDSCHLRILLVLTLAREDVISLLPLPESLFRAVTASELPHKAIIGEQGFVSEVTALIAGPVVSVVLRFHVPIILSLGIDSKHILEKLLVVSACQY